MSFGFQQQVLTGISSGNEKTVLVSGLRLDSLRSLSHVNLLEGYQRKSQNVPECSLQARVITKPVFIV
jgi:hypothetical protein